MRTAPLLLGMGLSGCVYTVVVEHETIDIDEPFSAVVIVNDVGELVVSGRADAATLEVTSRFHGAQPELTWSVSDGTLFIDGSCPKPHFTCSLDLALSFGGDADVSAIVQTGSAELRDLDGSTVLDLTTGSISLHRLGGSANVETTTGSISGTDLDLQTLIAKTTTGSIDTVHTGKPETIDAQTTTGSIDLLVPGGTYSVDASTSTGSVEVVGLIDNPAASSSIDAHTQTGSVRVIGYSPPVFEYLPACSASEGDPYSVLEANISGDTLTAVIEYSGGCAQHDLTLCWPDQSFMESDPVQVTVELLHDDHDDACDAVVTDTREFDLTSLRQAWRDSYQQASGTITLHLDGHTVQYDF